MGIISTASIFMHPLKSIGQILSLEQTFGVSLS